MKTVKNTAVEDRHPEWLFGSNPASIERQEATGQQSLIISDCLPVDVLPALRESLEKQGVVFGDVVPGDDLFRYVTLPPGWRKVADHHSMWSYLVDAEHNRQARIFYKAAFYDRRASMHALT